MLLLVQTFYHTYSYLTKNVFSFYCTFDQMNIALVNIRDFFQNHKKNLTDPKLFNHSLSVYIYIHFFFLGNFIMVLVSRYFWMQSLFNVFMFSVGFR